MVEAKTRARLNPSHDKRTRAKIQTSQIVNRLNKLIKGEVEMTSVQVTAALGLLKKVMPDMQAATLDAAIAHSGVDVQAHRPDTASLQAFALAQGEDDDQVTDAPSGTKH
jgi:hypothetical protein